MSVQIVERASSRKPDTATAMNNLIGQVREAIDFNMPISRLCDGPCTGCSKKLLEFLDTELEEWEYKLSQNESPNFGDIQALAKTSKKIYTVLKKNGIVEEENTNLIAKS
ncbi:MAG: hypothetical protein KC477_12990 [Oceanospirillaceae bacterium]|nr:hypothetical protein [Oceanospirillaceae bacterium]